MSHIHQIPEFTIPEVAEIVYSFFGITGVFKQFPSERDQNFFVRTAHSKKYVLKISNPTEKPEFLDAQNRLWDKLTETGITSPHAVRSKAGKYIETVNGYYIRLVTYLDGVPMGLIQEPTSELYKDLGSYLGRLNKSLANFDHPAFHRDFHWDLQSAPQRIYQYIHLIEDPSLREMISHITSDYVCAIQPMVTLLRKSVIHNDANDYNLIVTPANLRYNQDAKVVGLIDYGDVIYSYLISDLAVAIAYAVLDKPDPVEIAAAMVASFHQEYNLEEIELEILYHMICLRLSLSLCIGAYQSQQRPHDDYLLISRKSILKTLPGLIAVPERFMSEYFKFVCGYVVGKKLADVRKWLCAFNSLPPIFGEPLSTENSIALDLSISSRSVSISETVGASQPHFQDASGELVEKQNKRIGIGPANHPCLAYALPPFSEMHMIKPDLKTIRLGTDIYTSVPIPIFSPLTGRIYFVSRNGPNSQLILKHFIDEGETFYTRYRNLTVKENILVPGKLIQAGEQIGITVNKKDSPLNLQIITDLLGLEEDFPTHVSIEKQAVWELFSPDPTILLRIPDSLIPVQHPTKAETLKARKSNLGFNLSLGYRNPLKIERGWMQYLFDDSGRKYLDAYNNVPHVGHCHPKVVQAGQEQMSILNTNTRYLHDLINQYAERILQTLPAPLSVCFFVNSGSEANELALRLARAYTQCKDTIVLEAAYHGNTTTLIDISPYKHDGPGGYRPPDWVHTVPIPDLFRGRYRISDPQAVPKYLHHLQEEIEKINELGSGLSGFIAETCPSVGGQIFLPDNYLTEVYEMVRAAGGVCIADEVQTGYGRIGTHCYAFEAHKVVPDIVVLGKPIGNGHPIGAVITTQEIARVFDNGMEFFSTFGGNPVSCAIGIAVLDVVQSEGLQDHALEVGQYLLDGFRHLQSNFPLIGDVRGSGLFLGIELVRDPINVEPATQEADFIANKMRESGILLGTDGPDHNVIKIRPPMPFNMLNAQYLLDTFQRILSAYFP